MLRAEIAEMLKVPEVTKRVIARPVGPSHGRVVNWERGLEPSPRYAPKLREVEKQLKAGTLKVELPKRGPKPRARTKAAAKQPALRKVSALSQRRRVAMFGEIPASYANTVNVE